MIGAPRPVAISAVNQNKASGATFATTAAAPVGSLIVVVASNWSTLNSTITSVGPDSAGNTYALAVSSVLDVNLAGIAIYYSANIASPLPSGGTIPVTTSSGLYAAQALNVATASGVDQTATAKQTSTTSSTTLSTGALSNQPQVVIAAIRAETGAFGTWTPGAGFSTLSAFSNLLQVDCALVGSTAAVTWAPSWVNANALADVIATFPAISPLAQTHAPNPRIPLDRRAVLGAQYQGRGSALSSVAFPTPPAFAVEMKPPPSRVQRRTAEPVSRNLSIYSQVVPFGSYPGGYRPARRAVAQPAGSQTNQVLASAKKPFGQTVFPDFRRRTVQRDFQVGAQFRRFPAGPLAQFVMLSWIDMADVDSFAAITASVADLGPIFGKLQSVSSYGGDVEDFGEMDRNAVENLTSFP